MDGSQVLATAAAMYKDFMDLARQYQSQAQNTNDFAKYLSLEQAVQGPVDGISLVDYIDGNDVDLSLDGGLLGTDFDSYLASLSRFHLGLQPTKYFTPADVTVPVDGGIMDLGIPENVAIACTPRGPEDSLLPIVNGLYSEGL